MNFSCWHEPTLNRAKYKVCDRVPGALSSRTSAFRTRLQFRVMRNSLIRRETKRFALLTSCWVETLAFGCWSLVRSLQVCLMEMDPFSLRENYTDSLGKWQITCALFSCNRINNWKHLYVKYKKAHLIWCLIWFSSVKFWIYELKLFELRWSCAVHSNHYFWGLFEHPSALPKVFD